MRVFRRAVNSIVCIGQSILLVLPLPALAVPSESSAELSQIGNYEQVVFGTTKSGLSEEARVRALEQNIFGEAHQGRIRDRLKAIAKIMGKNSGQIKLKPEAPTLDTSLKSQLSAAVTSTAGSELPPPSPPPLAPSISERGENNHAGAGSSGYQPADKGKGGKSERVKDLLRQAISQYQSGNNALAEKTFRQVLQLDPGNPDAHFSLGAIAEGRGDLEGADQHYRSALRSSPDDSEIQQAVTALQNKMSDRKLAQQRQETEQKQIAQQEQQRAQLKRLSDDAANAYRNGKYDVAIRDLEQVAQQAPNDPDVQYALAQAYRGQGDFDRARYHIGQAIAQDPNNQMYRAVQSSLDQEVKSRNRPQVANDRGTGSRYSPQLARGYEDDAPAGQITPIAPEANPPRRDMEYGYASTGGGTGGLGGLLPSVAGLGLGYGLGSRGGGYEYGGGSSRLKRAAVGSLAGALGGAAMSAMFNHSPGSVKRGAVRGALFGGVAGLIFGGF